MAKDGALLILRETERTQEWSLGDQVVIGRDNTADIQLPDRQVSREHAVVRRTPDGYVVEDAGSKNGTWVNGLPVERPIRLTDGDEVNVAARYKLYFVDAEATAPLVFDARGLRIDHDTMDVYVNGEKLDPPLSGPQFELLVQLYNADGSLVTRDDIIGHIWPDADAGGVSEDAIDALVRRLRLRLEAADPEHPYIVTVRGYGYRFDNS